MSLLKLPQALALGFALAAAALRGGVAGFVLEVRMANPTGGTAAVFYDIGQWYSQRDSVRVVVLPGDALRTYRFDLPPEPIHRLRFDLTDHAGVVRIGTMRLLTAEGRVLDRFGPESIRPMAHIEGIQMRDGVAQVRAGPGNPMVLIDREEQPVTERALGRWFIGPPTIFLLTAVVLAAMLWPLAAALRTLPGGGWVFAGTFLVVFGFRLHWLKIDSRPMPYWDEWEMVGRDLLMPLRAHVLDWQALFLPQSEHRTLVSRLAALAASIANGEWDPRVEMVLGAAMYAASLGLLCAAAAWRARWWWLGAAITVAIGACPFDSHNLLCGDQCQMYALNLMALVVLVLAAARPTPGVVGAFAAACVVSLFTMASGLVAPLLGAVVAGLNRGSGVPPLQRPSRSGGDAASTGRAAMVLIGLAAGIAGMLLYREAPFQGPEYARTWTQFAGALVARLSWPLRPGVVSAALVWLPWLAFAACIPFRRARTAFDLLLLALGLWLLANAAGLAHGRPFDAWPFNNKYYTAMLLVAPLAVFSVLRLRPPLVALAAGLIAVPLLVSTGRWLSASAALSAQYHRQQAAYADTVRPFLRTDDRARLTGTSFEKLPYWNGAELAAQLDSPLMQPWLPAVLRECLADRPGSPYPARIAPGPLTLLSRTLMKLGLALAAAGAAVLLMACAPSRRPTPPG